MPDDLKERHSRILDACAKGARRVDAAKAAGVSRYTVHRVLRQAREAREAGDARAFARPANAGALWGVPRDLAKQFRAAAEARGVTPAKLRKKLIATILEDDLIDAILDDEDAPGVKGRMQ